MDSMCASCGSPMPDFARVCEHCGHKVAAQLVLPDLETTVQTQDSDTTPSAFDFSPEETAAPTDDLLSSELDRSFTPESDPTPEDVPASAGGVLFASAPQVEFGLEKKVAPPKSRRREIVMVAIVASISGIVTLGLLLSRSTPRAEAVAANASAGSTTDTVDRAAPISAAAVTRWTAANSAIWTGQQKHSIAFEVEAENTVSVWMRTVRPALVVRCSSGSVEVFVFTSSAARIEPKTEDHTVSLSLDGSAPVNQLWRDSEEHDSLFAPDGGAFARQLQNAQVMQFGFNPHNAAPVTAKFTVSGLRAMLASAARQCGKF